MLERSNSSKPEMEKLSTTTEKREVASSPVRTIAEKERAVRKVALGQIVESPPLKPESTRTPFRNFEQTERSKNTELPEYEKASADSLKRLEKPVYSDVKPPAEEAPTTAERKLSKETVRNIEQSSTQELLRVAHDIHIDGATVRELYESNQIDHRGLVSIVKEALRGGNVKKAYSKAKLGHEAQLGRKIEMRHDDPAFVGQDVQTTPTKASVERTNQLLSQLHQTEAPEPVTIQDSTPTPSTISDLSYDRVQDVMKKKRIATLTITLAIALTGAAALAWLFLG
jgi:hypothetical protein